MVVPGASGLCVYLIDGDPEHLEEMAREIRGLSVQYDVRVFADGSAALDVLRHQSQNPPDLVLLDVSVPGMAALDVLAAIKADERLRRIPVVMVTPADRPTEIVRAYNLGANGYIDKPSYRQELGAVLDNTLLYRSYMSRPLMPAVG